MLTTDNWIKSKDKPILSLNDKIKELLKYHYKLVLVQVHELQRIKLLKDKIKHVKYVDDLYQHYIIDNKPKTYLC